MSKANSIFSRCAGHEQCGRIRSEDDDAVADLARAGRGRELLQQGLGDRCLGHQNLSLTMRWREPAIFSCNCMIPSITISGRGGHPGT